MLSACTIRDYESDAVTDESGASISKDSDTTSANEGYAEEVLFQCIPAEGNRRIELYTEFREELSALPILTCCRIIDTGTGDMMREFDITDCMLSAYDLETGDLEDGFWIRNRTGEELFLFSFEEGLTRSVSIQRRRNAILAAVPADITRDGEYLAYFTCIEEDEESEDIYGLVLENLTDHSTRTIVTSQVGKGMVTGYSELFFNKSGTRIGFMGQTNPVPEEQSIDCYGYIDIETGEMKMTEKDQIQVACVGDELLISDAPRDVEEEKEAVIRMVSMEDGTERSYPTETARESEYVYAVDSEYYMTGVPIEKEDGSYPTIIRLYKGGKKMFQRTFEKNEGVLTMAYEKETDSIFLQYYSDEKQTYITETWKIT